MKELCVDTLMNKYTVSIAICLLGNSILGMETEEIINFACTGCNETFYSQDGLQKHFSDSLNLEKNAICFICKKIFRSNDELMEHISQCDYLIVVSKLMYERKSQFAMCEISNKENLYTRVAVEPVRKKRDRLAHYSCSECGKMFGETELVEHKALVHHILVGTPVYCPEKANAFLPTAAKVFTENNYRIGDVSVIGTSIKSKDYEQLSKTFRSFLSKQKVRTCLVCEPRKVFP